MLQLPNGCYCSNLTVHPSNWKRITASVKKDWRIQYRFYDPMQKEKYPKGMLRLVKGMNRYKNQAERKQATENMIRIEMDILTTEGYNPITKKFIPPAAMGEVSQNTPFIQALEYAFNKKSCVPKTKTDIKSCLKYVKEAIRQLEYQQMTIGDVERRHIKFILERCGINKTKWNAPRFNKYRTYLMSLFEELIEVEAVNRNPVRDIKKKKEVAVIRQTLTDEERKKVNDHLFKKCYPFWRFLHIFFHSGARETELMQLKKKDVDLAGQQFKVTIRKGNETREVMKTIKDLALPLWEEIMQNAGADDYLFGKGLVPRSVAIDSSQISRRWRRHVKNPVQKGGLGITADFYSLKHLNTDETAALVGIKNAAAQNSHTSTVITMKHYAKGEKKRMHETLKSVANAFAG